MSETKIVKKKDADRIILRQLIDTVKSDIADIRRRVNGVLIPIEKKLVEWERIEKQFN